MKTEMTLTIHDKNFVFVDKSLKTLAKLAIVELEKINSVHATDAIRKLKKFQMFFNLGKGLIVCSIIETK